MTALESPKVSESPRTLEFWPMWCRDTAKGLLTRLALPPNRAAEACPQGRLHTRRINGSPRRRSRLLPTVLGLALLTPLLAARHANPTPGVCTAESPAVSGLDRRSARGSIPGSSIVGDCNTLLGLMEDLRGTAWLNWSVDTTMDDWDGIQVRGNRVTALRLSGHGDDLTSGGINNLTGVIPPKLGQLTSLESLDLRDNNLSGSIPPELGQLTSLESLDLRGNSLSGSVPPKLGQLTSLESLDLRGNSLSGSIPPELGQLTSLVMLNLGGNLLSGSIPPELGQLTSLGTLVLALNQLSGCIPVELGRIPRKYRGRGWIINPQWEEVNLRMC